MFIIKVIYVYLYFFQNVRCILDDNSDGDAYDNSSKVSSENRKNYSKEHECKNHKNRNLNSTRVCEYQEIKSIIAVDEYKNTLINYPYAASILRQGSHYANGALVDKRWVLSSAGEFYNVRESIRLFRVRLGSVDCKKGGTVFPIILVRIHPLYNYGKPSFDLALLRLARPVTTTLVMRPISLSTLIDVGTVVEAKFMTTYWPRIVVKGKIVPLTAKERVKFKNMRISTQDLIPSTICTRMVKKLNDTSLCLKPIEKYHSSRCTPDAGAPIIAEDGLWGITSGWVSPKCLSKPSPTVFTRVSPAIVRFWIDSQLLP